MAKHFEGISDSETLGGLEKMLVRKLAGLVFKAYTGVVKLTSMTSRTSETYTGVEKSSSMTLGTSEECTGVEKSTILKSRTSEACTGMEKVTSMTPRAIKHMQVL